MIRSVVSNASHLSARQQLLFRKSSLRAISQSASTISQQRYIRRFSKSVETSDDSANKLSESKAEDVVKSSDGFDAELLQSLGLSNKRRDRTTESIERAIRRSQRKTKEELVELRDDPSWPPTKENKILQALAQTGKPMNAAELWEVVEPLDVVESKRKMKFFLQRLKKSKQIVTKPSPENEKQFLYQLPQ
eukprot:CAMPEP_0184036906 /NCGR_PEP_ID=MMETSP0955-20130417/35350_1 /TAXON_ID=627963 /ORGANISM="Aplanochytrium sp, Strain PBS07" /LENGTH=190 /DNA_ID=CAMNT_0026324747 /DNA_START=208 /DNA_END=777 /DNA_ORIENTATION=-